MSSSAYLMAFQDAEAQGSFSQFRVGVMLVSAIVISVTYFIARQVMAVKARLLRS